MNKKLPKTTLNLSGSLKRQIKTCLPTLKQSRFPTFLYVYLHTQSRNNPSSPSGDIADKTF